jgi:hypothetical protein
MEKRNHIYKKREIRKEEVKACCKIIDRVEHQVLLHFHHFYGKE